MERQLGIQLNDGNTIPKCGLGTFNLQDPEKSVYEAIKLGVRLIDTALFYKNEKAVGEGIKKAISEGFAKREELYVITKLWPSHYHKAEETIQEQLKTLGLDYVDMYLVHWPISLFNYESNKFEKVSIIKLWAEIETFIEKKYTRSIGVSNFSTQLLLELINNSKIVPAVNEIELHPYLTQFDLRDFLNIYNIKVIAYNSLMKGVYTLNKDYLSKFQLFEEEIVKKLYKKYNKSEAQIVLNWAISQDIVVIPKANSAERIKENQESLTFSLEKEEIEEISKLNANVRFCIKHDFFGNFNAYA